MVQAGRGGGDFNAKLSKNAKFTKETLGTRSVLSGEPAMREAQEFLFVVFPVLAIFALNPV